MASSLPLRPPGTAVGPDGVLLKIPQMGWNRVRPVREHPLWEGIEPGARFYFVHSYYVDPVDRALVAATTDYGLDYASRYRNLGYIGVLSLE